MLATDAILPREQAWDRLRRYMEIKVELPAIRISSQLSSGKSRLNTRKHAAPYQSELLRHTKLLIKPRPQPANVTTSCILSPKSQGNKSPVSTQSLSPLNKQGKRVDWSVEASRLWRTRDMSPITLVRTKLMNTRRRLPRVRKEDSFARLFSVYKQRKTEIRVVGERLHSKPKARPPQLDGWETPAWEQSALLQ